MKLVKWLSGLAIAALLAVLGAAPASAQYMYMDTNGDGVWSTADVLNPNGTPTTVDVYLNTSHNRDGSTAHCDSGDPDATLETWNSYAVHILTPTGTVTYSNFVNDVPTFTIGCVTAGNPFSSNTTEMAACQATGAPEPSGGLVKMFTVTVTGTSGTPSLQFVPLNSLDNNPTSFGTPCGGLDFDNTYKLGTDWFDVNGAGPAPGGNALPILSVPTTATGTEGQPITITATATDTDAADLLTITATGYPSSLTLTTTPATGGTVTATLTGTLGLDDQGDHTITWSVTDGTNPAVTGTTVLTVVNLDQAPVVTAAATFNGAVGTPISMTVTATDPDGDVIGDLSAAPLPVGASFTANAGNTAGTLEWTPIVGQEGTTSITFTATNSLSGSATTEFTIAGSGADVAPTVTAPTTFLGTENVLVTFTVTASDPDGDAITSLTATSLPTGATFTANGANTEGTFNWTPTYEQSGTYTVTWTASNALSGTASTAITVQNADQPPTLAAIGDVTIAEGGSQTINVTATDLDGDLVILDATLPPFAVLNAPTSGTGSVATTISLSPTAGSAGTYTATVRAVSGSFVDSTSFTITVTGAGADQAPVVTAPATQIGTEESLLTFTVTASDPDGDAIASLTASPLPSGATFTANGSNTEGTFSWTPTNTQSGTYDVTFTASNALTGSASTHITINDLAADQAPIVTAPSNQSGTEGTLLTFTVTASDPDGDAITSLTASPLPTGATFTANGTNTAGTFSWTPDNTQSGAYDVTFTASNALSGSATTHIAISEPGADQAPVVTAPATQTGTEGSLLTFTVTASDPDGDAIASLTASPLPAGATFTANGTNTSGTFSWTPDNTQSGTYDVTFTASNALSGSATTHITINDLTANQAPVVTAPATQTVNEGQLLTFTVTATDADGDHVTLTASNVPSGATFTDNGNNTGTFSWTPNSTQSGTYTVTFTGNDGNGGTGTATTVITVNDVTGGAFTATAKLVGNFNSHRRFLCFHIVPTSGSFDITNVDLASVQLNYNGGTLTALSGQTHVESDCDEEEDCEECGTTRSIAQHAAGDCTDQLHACFLMSDVAALFGGDIPDNLANATITGNLTTGGTFTATIGALRVVGVNAKSAFKSKAKPNPLNPKTDLTFTLPTAAHVRVSVFDARGRFVKTLLDGDRPAGENVVPWDGTDDRGGHVASGVFFFRLEALGSKEMVRVTVLK